MIFTVLRLVFGLFWLIFGLNYFVQLFPTPAPQGNAATLMNGLDAAGYMLPMMYATQFACGALLLAGRFVPLSLVLLAPITLNIVLYDLFLNPSGLAIGAVVAAIHATLLYRHQKVYMELLTTR